MVVLNETKKEVVLKKYNGSAWADATEIDLPTGVYKYYRRQNGVELDTDKEWKTGKVIFVDRELVNKNLVINCEAEISLTT